MIRIEGQIVVANPGHVPHMVHSALAFAPQGRLGRYVAPFATTQRDLDLAARLPTWMQDRVVRELSRRRVPEELDPYVRKSATLIESALIFAKRAGAPRRLERLTAEARDALFDRSVAKGLDGSEAALFAAFNAAVESIRRAQRIGVPVLLEHTVAHHAFASEILTEECRRVPDYATTMQFHDVSARRRSRLKEELDAADRVITLSTFQKQTFVDRGVSEERIVVNPLGIDLDRFAPGTHRESGRFRVLFVGQLTQRKGLSYAVEGFRQAGIRGAELVLLGHPVGGAPWRGVPGVRHLPMIPPAETPEIYRTADVLVLPALVEGLARVPLEAMASGLPVIVTPNTGAEDVMVDGEHGFVVPIRDAEAIADRLRLLHESPHRRHAMGRAARSQMEHFSWDAFRGRVVAAVDALR